MGRALLLQGLERELRGGREAGDLLEDRLGPGEVNGSEARRARTGAPLVQPHLSAGLSRGWPGLQAAQERGFEGAAAAREGHRTGGDVLGDGPLHGQLCGLEQAVADGLEFRGVETGRRWPLKCVWHLTFPYYPTDT